MEKQRKTFLSYSRANKDFAVRLARELKSEGFNVWLDQLDIPLGARWDVEVERALEESEIFMIIMTPASITSENVRDEIGYAIDNGKRFLPILLENCNVPLRLRRFQYVDFTNKSFDEGVESAKELLRGLIALPTMPRIDVTEEERRQLAQAEADRKAREEAERLAAQKAEEERLAKARAEVERKAKAEAERKAKAEARRKAKAEEERAVKARLEAERLAAQKAEAERLAQQKAEEERLAKAEAQRKAKEEANRKAEEERLALAKAEAERKAREVREAKAEADRLAVQKAEAERLAKQKAEEQRLALAKAEADRKAKQEADQIAAKKAKVRSSEAEPAAIVTTHKKPASRGLIFGVAGVAALAIVVIGYGVVSNLGTTSATEAPTSSTSATEAQPTNTVSVSTETPELTMTVQSNFSTIKFTDNTDLGEFTYFDYGDGNKLSVAPSDSSLKFVLSDKDLFVYYIYQYVYKDVAVRIRAKDISKTTNQNIGLICRYSGDSWYEFGIAKNGGWSFYIVTNEYRELNNGVTKAVSSDNYNDYEMRCVGDRISLYINEQEVATFTNDDLFLRGKVGFNIGSYNQVPTEVLVREFEVSAP